MNTLSSHSTLVTLNVYNSDVDAHIAKGLLESNGIKCIIDNEIMSSIYPIPFSTIGQVRLMVCSATRILRANFLRITCLWSLLRISKAY